VKFVETGYDENDGLVIVLEVSLKWNAKRLTATVNGHGGGCQFHPYFSIDLRDESQ